jgi:hypothetical protein
MEIPHWPTLFAWGRSQEGRRALSQERLFPPYRNADLLRVYRAVQERAAATWNGAIVHRREESEAASPEPERAQRQPA